MSPSPDDRFRDLLHMSRESGWQPEDAIPATSAQDGYDTSEEERKGLLPPRKIVLWLALLTLAVMVVMIVWQPKLHSKEAPIAAKAALSATGQEAARVEDITGATVRPHAGSTRQNGNTGKQRITVHIVGEVKKPAVISLPPGARVHDALEKVGGHTKEANLVAINLARPLSDGEQIVVPNKDDAVLPEAAGSAAGHVRAANAGSGSGTGENIGGAPVNINTADARALETLPGVGPATAQAILTYREEHGRYTTVDDLENVSGIGPKTVDKLRGLVTV